MENTIQEKQIIEKTEAVLEFHGLPKQKKWLGFDISWKENKSALIGAFKWIAFLLFLNVIRVLIFK